MKRVVAVLLVLVMVCVSICYAESTVDQEAVNGLMQSMEAYSATREIQASIYEKVEFLKEKYENGEELNNSEVFLAIQYTRLIMLLEMVQGIEVTAWISEGQTLQDMAESSESIYEGIEYLDTFEKYLLDEVMDKKIIMDTIAKTFDLMEKAAST